MDQPGKARGRRWAAWAWVLATLPAVAVAQSVHIGGTTLTLGAPKALALG